MRKVTGLAVLALTLSFGCAGNNEQTTIATPPAGTQSPAAMAKMNDHGTATFTSKSFKVEVEQDNDGSDYYFKPTVIKAPGGATATVELRNEGSVPHTFTIDALHIDEQLQPDAKKTVTVQLGSESKYEFYCRFHESSGMRGAFELG